MIEHTSNFVLWFTKLTGAIPTAVYLKPKIFYENKNAKQIEKSAILISNHQSLMDFPLMLLLFPLRTVRYLMSESIFGKGKLLSWFLYKIGGIRIEREKMMDAEYIARIYETLDSGGLIGIFPEGRLNPNEEMLEFKPGAAYFSLKTELPVMPVYKDGNYGLFKRVHVIVGEPVYLRKLFKDDIDAALITEASAYLRSKLIDLKLQLKKHLDGTS